MSDGNVKNGNGTISIYLTMFLPGEAMALLDRKPFETSAATVATSDKMGFFVKDVKIPPAWA